MIKKYFYAILIGLSVNSIAILSGAINWYIQFAVTATVFFISGILYYYLPIKRYVYFLIICFPFFFYTTFTIYNLLAHVYPISIIPYISFFIGTFISNHKRKLKWKIQYSILYLLFILNFAILIMPNYLSYVFNKDYNDIEKQSVKFQKFDFYDSFLNEVEIQKMQGKIIVLDFWTTSCGVCYRKFPEFEKLSEQYKTNDNIKFYAVNIITKRDSIEKVINQTKTLGYKFPFLFTKASDVKSIREKFGIYSFPTIIIIDKLGNIVFHGQLITDDIILYNNTKKTIVKLLNQ